MLATQILDRSTGVLTSSAFARKQTSRLVHALQPAPHVHFDGSQDHEAGKDISARQGEDLSQCLAHRSGVNALTVERFEGR